MSTAFFGLLVATEGLIVGLTKVLFDRARERAREEGIRQGEQRTIERLRRLGVRIPDEIISEENTEESKKRR